MNWRRGVSVNSRCRDRAPGPWALTAGVVPRITSAERMHTISLRLSESLHAQARVLAEQEGISINQLIATSPVEKMSALLTQAYLEARAKRGSKQAFQGVLKKGGIGR